MTTPSTIALDQFLSHPPAVVWRALTEPELHARWWAAGDIRPEVGHRFELDMGEWGAQPCVVTEVEQGSMIRYVFAEGLLDTTITWRLEPEGSGTRLFLEHAGFDIDSPMGQAAFGGMGSGWPGILAAMDRSLSAALA